MPGMDDAWVRINRAKEHVKRLEADVVAFREANPHAHTVGIKHDGKGKVQLVAQIAAAPPKEWGLTAGDVFVELRAALDYAIYALAVAHTGQPRPPYDDRLEFPICDLDTKWRQAIGRHKLAGVPANAVDYIDSIQPYQAGLGGDTGVLFALDAFAGVIKHRFIYTAWSRLDTVSLPMKLNGLSITDVVKFSHPGELKDGAPLVSFRLVANQKRANIQIEASLSTKVVIEPISKGWIDLMDFVGKIGPYVEHIVGELERFLAPGHQAPPPGTPITLRTWWGQ